jgi:peptidyl-prolyl cis-trans isomerase B (cyclophilin B)
MSRTGLRPAWRTRGAAALLLLGLLALAGCGGSSPKATTENGCTVVGRPPLGARSEPKPSALLGPKLHYDVTLLTNCGSFTFRLDQAQSPHAAAAFVALVKAGYFNKTIFHRIAPGFVIQGGDPTGSGGGGPGFTTVDTPPASAAYTHGVVAMAKTGAQAAGTAGSQFFVVTEPDAGLPPDYAIIGKVTSGLAVVDRIGKLGNAAQQPTMVVEIEQAEVKVSG